MAVAAPKPAHILLAIVSVVTRKSRASVIQTGASDILPLANAEYEKMVQAQQQLDARKLQQPGPHKAASEPVMNVPACNTAGSMPESPATSRLGPRPSAPPALMDDYPAELPTRASLPVGAQQQQAPEPPARRPRDDFEDSLSCPITQVSAY